MFPRPMIAALTESEFGYVHRVSIRFDSPERVAGQEL